ncbi:MAG: 6,7-dimethyl-8-ribityllumazine synthase, partial [bacterium]|nr:6,7-dimethyl-8-ribityllumazine synthase [bacterium]
MRFAIILSRFNEHIGSKLLEGAKETLLKNGIADQDIETFFVPGAFEIPLIAKKLAQTKKYDAVIALGCLLR